MVRAGRLKSGVSAAEANQEFQQLVQRSGEITGKGTHGFHPKNHPIVLAGFQDEVVRGVRLAMLVLLGAVVFVLLISSVNVANLLLARAESRRRENRCSQGHWREPRAIAGPVRHRKASCCRCSVRSVWIRAGLRGVQLIVRTNPGSLPRASEIGIDTAVLLFTIGVSFLTGIVFGFAPLMHLVGQNLHETLKAAAGRTTGGSGTHRFRGALVVVELALALMLLIGTGLMLKTFWRLQNVNAGFNPDNVVTARITLPQSAYTTPESRAAFWANAQARVAGIPGVLSASTVTGLAPGCGRSVATRPPNRRLRARVREVDRRTSIIGMSWGRSIRDPRHPADRGPLPGRRDGASARNSGD